MKQLCIFLSVVLLFFACATKRKTKEVEKTEIKTENILKNDSVVQSVFKVDKLQSNQTFKEFESVLKALNVQYDGDQANELNVTLNHTENGTELNVKGKGKANYNEQSEQTKVLTRDDVAMILDSILDVRIMQYKIERSEKLVDSFQSDTEKDKTDISFWIYFIIGSVLFIGTAIYILIKKLKSI